MRWELYSADTVCSRANFTVILLCAHARKYAVEDATHQDASSTQRLNNTTAKLMKKGHQPRHQVQNQPYRDDRCVQASLACVQSVHTVTAQGQKAGTMLHQAEITALCRTISTNGAQI
jgi:hypothetical protein